MVTIIIIFIIITSNPEPKHDTCRKSNQNTSQLLEGLTALPKSKNGEIQFESIYTDACSGFKASGTGGHNKPVRDKADVHLKGGGAEAHQMKKKSRSMLRSWIWSGQAWNDTDCAVIGRINDKRSEMNQFQHKNTKSE